MTNENNELVFWNLKLGQKGLIKMLLHIYGHML